MPILWRRQWFGFPPCSPQIPTFNPGRVLRPSLIDFHQLSDAFLIQYLEWILSRMPFSIYSRHKGTHVITAETKGHLGKVVGSEGKEFGVFCNLICNKLPLGAVRSWYPTCTQSAHPFSALLLFAILWTLSFNILNSCSVLIMGNMISVHTATPFFLHIAGGLNDCLYLHVVNFRIRNTQGGDHDVPNMGFNSVECGHLVLHLLRLIFICFAISF